uniref:Retrotransposon gag domain-containing protein n=1 Tax=Astyanax mexicanus TaxID=7994 RepID=A0A3B1JYI4_ASTMX
PPGHQRLPLPNPLTERSSPNMDPAEQLDLEQVKIALGNQGVAIGKHEQTLQQILAQLRDLTTILSQNLLQPIQPAPLGPAPPQVEELMTPGGVEPSLPTPVRYGGQPGGCRGFLLQCSLSECAKVAYIISLLSGRALAWATPVWENQPAVCATATLFAAALSWSFDLPARGEEAGTCLLNLHQHGRSVSDYAIEFCTLSAESGWNSSALVSAFHHGLSEDLKDELAHRDCPASLDDLIELTQKIDHCLRERRRRGCTGRVRGPRDQPSAGGSSLASKKQPDHGDRPVQLGHTRLPRQEREARMREGRCIYCGLVGHQRVTCPDLAAKSQHLLGEEGPLTDRPGPLTDRPGPP